MRLVFAATVAALFATNLLGAEAVAAPAPGKASTFVVPFDCDKAALTAKGQAAVTQAVDAVKAIARKSLTEPGHDAFHYVDVVVTGHTDTVGSDKDDQALSLRRANAVKDEMVRQGLFANGISAKGESFHDLAVHTATNVREPQNCRAVVVLGG